MATIRVVSTAVSPLVILAMLERARAALDHGEPMAGARSSTTWRPGVLAGGESPSSVVADKIARDGWRELTPPAVVTA
jgi:hypothetical protein